MRGGGKTRRLLCSTSPSLPPLAAERRTRLEAAPGCGERAPRGTRDRGTHGQTECADRTARRRRRRLPPSLSHAREGRCYFSHEPPRLHVATAEPPSVTRRGCQGSTRKPRDDDAASLTTRKYRRRARGSREKVFARLLPGSHVRSTSLSNENLSRHSTRLTFRGTPWVEGGRADVYGAPNFLHALSRAKKSANERLTTHLLIVYRYIMLGQLAKRGIFQREKKFMPSTLIIRSIAQIIFKKFWGKKMNYKVVDERRHSLSCRPHSARRTCGVAERIPRVRGACVDTTTMGRATLNLR